MWPDQILKRTGIPALPLMVTAQRSLDGTVVIDSDAGDTQLCDEEWEASLDNEIFCEKMIRMSRNYSCKADDVWVPYRLQWLTE